VIATPGIRAVSCQAPADLSFNRIRKIEGLEALSNLTDLTLYNNEIRMIGALEGLSQLQCLSLGNNQIDQVEQVRRLREGMACVRKPERARLVNELCCRGRPPALLLMRVSDRRRASRASMLPHLRVQILYLKRLPKLEVLVMDGNPMARSRPQQYRSFSLAFLPQLKYLDYALVLAADVRSYLCLRHPVPVQMEARCGGDCMQPPTWGCDTLTAAMRAESKVADCTRHVLRQQLGCLPAYLPVYLLAWLVACMASPHTQVAAAKETGVTPDLLAAVEDKEAQRRKQRDAADARAKVLAEVGAANIDAVETLWADLFAHDAEYARLRAMPKMPDALDDLKKNFDAATAEFRENGLEKSARIEVRGGEGAAARSSAALHGSACNPSACHRGSYCLRGNHVALDSRATVLVRLPPVVCRS
jgi:hypothetical protein